MKKIKYILIIVVLISLYVAFQHRSEIFSKINNMKMTYGEPFISQDNENGIQDVNISDMRTTEVLNQEQKYQEINKDIAFSIYSLSQKIQNGGNISNEMALINRNHICQIDGNIYEIYGTKYIASELQNIALNMNISQNSVNPKKRISFIRKNQHISKINNEKDLTQALLVASEFINNEELQKSLDILKMIEKSNLLSSELIEKISIFKTQIQYTIDINNCLNDR